MLQTCNAGAGYVSVTPPAAAAPRDASGRPATRSRCRCAPRTRPRCATLLAAPPPPPRPRLRRRTTDHTRAHTASCRDARPARATRRGRSTPPCAAPAARRGEDQGMGTSPLKSTRNEISHRDGRHVLTPCPPPRMWRGGTTDGLSLTSPFGTGDQRGEDS